MSRELPAPEMEILGDALVSHLQHLWDIIDDFDGNRTRRDMYGKLEAVDDWESQYEKALALMRKHWPDREQELEW